MNGPGPMFPFRERNQGRRSSRPTLLTAPTPRTAAPPCRHAERRQSANAGRARDVWQHRLAPPSPSDHHQQAIH
eukprot:scaffold4545_cov111-Isochrysis_galbana.AAC.20